MLPALLIGVGLLFLLNTLEIIDWRIWGGLWRLWPLILVAVGLEILVGRRSAAASAIIAVGMLVVMAAALWFWSVQPYTSLSGTTNIDQPLQGAKSAQVTINSGVGDLNVAPLAGSQSLVTGVVNTMNNEVLTQDFHMTGSTAYYTLASKSNWSLPFSDNTFGNHTWNLNLNSTVPTNLSINTGVGNADLNLEKLNLSRLDVAAGAGNTIVKLPAQGVLGANIRAGVGDLIISVPSGAAARIEIVSGLGNKVVPANYEHNGNVYQSPDYSTSKNKVDLHVDAGVGNITVR